MTNETEMAKDLINKWSERANEYLEDKHKAELKTIQLRGILNIIMGKVEGAITHDEYSAEVIRDISRVLDERYDLINEE
tara:strand:- start:270 stop:506 length:237 start_codon:yes stop_codon:yes gene_type:complete